MGFTVTPHINFRGGARAALEFYAAAFEGEATLVTYGGLGQGDAAHSPDDVAWGQVTAADGFCLMAFDVQAERAYDPGANAFFVALRGTSADAVQKRWSALSDGATVLQAIGPSAWSPLYGMLTDRFGVTWIVGLEPASA